MHDDYDKQFLDHAKTYPSKNIILHVFYESLQGVIHNFQRGITRASCAKINYLTRFCSPGIIFCIKNKT